MNSKSFYEKEVGNREREREREGGWGHRPWNAGVSKNQKR
jgi:hypothetical protein